MRTALFLSIVSGFAVALPAQDALGSNAGPDPSLATQVSFQGKTFINKVRRPSFLSAHDQRALLPFVLPSILMYVFPL